MNDHEIDIEEIKFLRQRETEFDSKVSELERHAFELELENTKLQGVIQTREKDVMKVWEQLQEARERIADLEREAKGMEGDYRVILDWANSLKESIDVVFSEMKPLVNGKTLISSKLLEKWHAVFSSHFGKEE